MKRLNWNNAIYYGEVFGFVFAWAVGLVVALSHSGNDSSAPEANKVVSAGAAGLPLD
ncbi:hypothetical protein KOR34_27490 [Posidoniimonas corsicana]|uniref:Uncharacterized protein n=1 Tax=Posidoniimonas corsicana TaxID=1938618 RepID=A0A5C5VJ08_9BACT|nr:hypothetical protein [Posidoniimonas corsicana]TWT37785.1 hypothetical protein KOR34_27490 [Posidoniimonas corsicana]